MSEKNNKNQKQMPGQPHIVARPAHISDSDGLPKPNQGEMITKGG